MNEKDKASSGAKAQVYSPSQDSEAAKKRLRTETSSASRAASETADAVKKEAGELGEEVQHFAEDQADKVKEATASHLDVFAEALKAASDELGKNHSGPAAEMVTHAASGLENLSRSLHGKSTGEMLDSVREFGRDNPVGFLAGSLLAGFALSRFAAAGMSSETTSAGSTASASSNASVRSSSRSPQASSFATSSGPKGATPTDSPSQGGTQR